MPIYIRRRQTSSEKLKSSVSIQLLTCCEFTEEFVATSSRFNAFCMATSRPRHGDVIWCDILSVEAKKATGSKHFDQYLVKGDRGWSWSGSSQMLVMLAESTTVPSPEETRAPDASFFFSPLASSAKCRNLAVSEIWSMQKHVKSCSLSPSLQVRHWLCPSINFSFREADSMCVYIRRYIYIASSRFGRFCYLYKLCTSAMSIFASISSLMFYSVLPCRAEVKIF